MSLSKDDLERLSATSIREAIPVEDLKAALSNPPFIPALLNLRDLSLLSPIKRHIYRSGTLQDTPETVSWLSEHVTKIFDLRHDREVTRGPDPVAPGVENVRRDMTSKGERLDVKEFTGDGSAAWKKQYMIILELYAPTLRAILEHVRDGCEPFLFHCTAGRDRTGVVAGMLHHLAGTPEDDVVYDYMLSRIGLEPARDKLVLAIKAGFSAEDIDSPEFFNVASLRPSYWAGFMEGLSEKYGGWDGYIKHLGFDDEEVAKMKDNLTRP